MCITIKPVQNEVILAGIEFRGYCDSNVLLFLSMCDFFKLFLWVEWCSYDQLPKYIYVASVH